MGKLANQISELLQTYSQTQGKQFINYCHKVEGKGEEANYLKLFICYNIISPPRLCSLSQ